MLKPKPLCLLLVVTLLAACTEGPGRLEGTWKMQGLIPLTVTYRDDEEESMGLINKVTYKSEGNDVLVTYVDGFAKGTTMRITIISKTSANTAFGRLTRIR